MVRKIGGKFFILLNGNYNVLAEPFAFDLMIPAIEEEIAERKMETSEDFFNIVSSGVNGGEFINFAQNVADRFGS